VKLDGEIKDFSTLSKILNKWTGKVEILPASVNGTRDCVMKNISADNLLSNNVTSLLNHDSTLMVTFNRDIIDNNTKYNWFTRASKKQILRYVIFPNSLPEILTGIRVAVGMCWGTLVAAEFLAGTTGIGFVENVAKKYFQYEVIWITIFIMGMLGLLFDVTLRKLIDKYIPWRGKG